MTDPRNDPTTFSLLTYLWVLGLAFWGGLASFIGKYKRGDVRAFNIAELLGELCVSGLTGVLTFYLCTWAKLDPLLTAALVGITGHMGSRAIMRAEKFLENRAKKYGGGE